MVHNKTLVMTALMLGLSAGAANAHEIPLPTSGDPYILTEPTITWANGVGTSTNNPIINNQVAAYHFDVTTAGSLDVYTNDHDDANGNANLFFYKLDADGLDWSLVKYNNMGEGPVTGPTDPNNIFGVHRTGYLDQNNAGTSDAGVRTNFDLGSYVAFVVGSMGYTVGHTPYDAVPDPTGAKLSAGFTWSYTGDTIDTYGNTIALTDITFKASPGSLAVVGATVEPPINTPVPGAVWLMGTVLAGFTAFGRKKAAIAA
jgi:hypothetical protein